jgi:hypothetical protein
MIAEMATFVIALNTGSFVGLSTEIAEQVESLFIQGTFNLGPRIICEEDIGVPIDANYMSPKFIMRVNTFDYTINVIAEEASYFSTFHLFILVKLDAPLTVPTSIRQAINDFTTIARLVSSSITKITDDNLIVLFMFVVEAYVALNIFIYIILININSL